MFSVLTTVFFAGCSSVTLDLPPGDPSDLTVDELMEKMKAASDPTGIYNSSKSYILRQSVVSLKNAPANDDDDDSADVKPPGPEANREEYTMETIYKSPDKLRYNSYKDGKPFSIIIFNGGNAWSINPTNNKTTPIPKGLGLSLVKTFAEMVKPGNDPKKIFKTVDLSIIYEGKEKFYRLVCDTGIEGMPPYAIYVDGNTFLTRKLQTVLYANDGSQYIYTAVTDRYVWIHDVRIAQVSTILTADKTDKCYTRAFQLNVDIPDDSFEPKIPFTYRITGE